jgi:hypothetical protein
LTIDLKQIKPKVRGESDKYSWNLYKFLNKLFKDKEFGKYYQNQIEFHFLNKSRWDGSWVEFDPEEVNSRQVIIIPYGLGNCRTFYSLESILTKGRSENFALPWGENELTNITEWFAGNYPKLGRCIFDKNHTAWMQGTDNRFTYVKNTRKCNWCGEWHKKEIIKEVKIKRREVWA